MLIITDLPWPLGLNPNDRLLPCHKRTAQKASREAALILTRSAFNGRAKKGVPFAVPKLGVIPIRYTAHPPPRGKQWDDDNLIAAMKWARDGIAEALGIDDKRFVVQPPAWGDRVKGGAITVEVGHGA